MKRGDNVRKKLLRQFLIWKKHKIFVAFLSVIVTTREWVFWDEKLHSKQSKFHPKIELETKKNFLKRCPSQNVF